MHDRDETNVDMQTESHFASTTHCLDQLGRQKKYSRLSTVEEDGSLLLVSLQMYDHILKDKYCHHCSFNQSTVFRPIKNVERLSFLHVACMDMYIYMIAA